MRTHSLLAAALTAALTSAQDLASALGSEDSLSSLVELLGQYPDTTDFLASQDGVTLFAPNNEALSSLGGNLEASAVDDLLRYHLYQGVIRSSDISDVPQFPASYYDADNLVSFGQVASVVLDGGNVIVTSGLKAPSQVVTADIKFDNGIIHIIDSVLTIPEPVADTLIAGGLTALAGAATELDLVSTLEGLGDVTIFAPNNDAFRAIADAASGLSSAQLIEILQYHVISGTAVYSNLLGNTSVPTLQGTTVDIAISPDGAVFIDGARVINSDVLIANGVLHVIDAVLNPDEENPQPGQPGFPTADSDSVPFTSGVPQASSVLPELSGTTSLVAAILVTAAPEPQTILLQDGTLSTSGGGLVPSSGSASATGMVTSTTSAVSGGATGSAASSEGAGEDVASSSAAASGTAGSSSESGAASASSAAPAQQTGNAGVRKEWPVLAAAAAAVGACAVAL